MTSALVEGFQWTLVHKENRIPDQETWFTMFSHCHPFKYGLGLCHNGINNNNIIVNNRKRDFAALLKLYNRIPGRNRKMSNVPTGYSSEDLQISKPTGSNSQMQLDLLLPILLLNTLKSLGSFNREQTSCIQSSLQSMPNRDCFKYLDLSRDTKLTRCSSNASSFIWGKQQPAENGVSFFH